jgi:hypothetical protein
MAIPTFVSHAVTWWSALYGDHHLVSVGIRYLHLGGLIVGGGTALTIDRLVLGAARRAPTDRAVSLDLLSSSHRVVVPALAVVALTGVLMTAADAGVFLVSWLYWLKIGLVALLGVNGGLLVAAERAIAAGKTATGWARLAVASGASVVLWLLVLLVGTWLTVAA